MTFRNLQVAFRTCEGIDYDYVLLLVVGNSLHFSLFPLSAVVDIIADEIISTSRSSSPEREEYISPPINKQIAPPPSVSLPQQHTQYLQVVRPSTPTIFFARFCFSHTRLTKTSHNWGKVRKIFMKFVFEQWGFDVSSSPHHTTSCVSCCDATANRKEEELSECYVFHPCLSFESILHLRVFMKRVERRMFVSMDGGNEDLSILFTKVSGGELTRFRTVYDNSVYSAGAVIPLPYTRLLLHDEVCSLLPHPPLKDANPHTIEQLLRCCLVHHIHHTHTQKHCKYPKEMMSGEELTAIGFGVANVEWQMVSELHSTVEMAVCSCLFPLIKEDRDIRIPTRHTQPPYLLSFSGLDSVFEKE
jgi:hypothetical protein